MQFQSRHQDFYSHSWLDGKSINSKSVLQQSECEHVSHRLITWSVYRLLACMRAGFPNWWRRCLNASQRPTLLWWTGWSGHSNITQPQLPTPSRWAGMWPSLSTGYRSETKLRLPRAVTIFRFEYVRLQSGSILC